MGPRSFRPGSHVSVARYDPARAVRWDPLGLPRSSDADWRLRSDVVSKFGASGCPVEPDRPRVHTATSTLFLTISHACCSARCHLSHAVDGALLLCHAHRMLSGAFGPMVCLVSRLQGGACVARAVVTRLPAYRHRDPRADLPARIHLLVVVIATIQLLFYLFI